MHRDVGMIEQERLDSRCFVAADVVADHVNLLRGAVGRHDLSEKGDELGTGVARCSLAQHFAGLIGPVTLGMKRTRNLFGWPATGTSAVVSKVGSWKQ